MSVELALCPRFYRHIISHVPLVGSSNPVLASVGYNSGPLAQCQVPLLLLDGISCLVSEELRNIFRLQAASLNGGPWLGLGPRVLPIHPFHWPSWYLVQNRTVFWTGQVYSLRINSYRCTFSQR